MTTPVVPGTLWDCALALRGSGARVFVLGFADMGYDCSALRGSGARVFVCEYADMGYDCAALRGSGARVSCVRFPWSCSGP